MRLAALFALLGGAAAAESRTLYCQSEDPEGFALIINLDVTYDWGGPMHCVAGAQVEGWDRLIPCAPNGGWGLTGEDGGPARLVTEARGLRHDGWWFFAREGPSEFVASASHGTRPPLALEVAGETFWRLRLDLATGQGLVETAGGEEPFSCLPP